MEADLGWITYLHVQQKTSRLPKRNTVLSLCEQISSTISIHDGKMYDLSVTSEPRIKIGTLESTNQWIANLIRSTIPTTLNSNIVYMKYMININL